MYGDVRSATESEDRRGAVRSVLRLGETGLGLGGERGDAPPALGPGGWGCGSGWACGEGGGGAARLPLCMGGGSDGGGGGAR